MKLLRGPIEVTRREEFVEYYTNIGSTIVANVHGYNFSAQVSVPRDEFEKDNPTKYLDFARAFVILAQ